MEQLGQITLHLGDCMDVLRSLPDNAFQLAIVDPPYGNGLQDGNANGKFNRFGGLFDRYKADNQQITPPICSSGTDSGGHTFAKYKEIGWDVAPTEEYFKELFRVTKNQIIWGANYFPNMPPTRCFVVWRKPIPETFSMAMCEYAWTSFNANAKVFDHGSQGTPSDPRFHPTQKPVALYGWLLNQFAKPGDRILDTHLGSGSSAIAAHELGYEMLGIEIDPGYYAKARQRLINRQRQQLLFN